MYKDDEISREREPGSDPEIVRFQNWFRRDKEAWSKWREEAEESYRFVAGDQWKPEEKAYLQKHGRPPITFNRVAPIIRAVIGTEITNRQEVRYLPREAGDNAGVEIWTEAGRWFRDQSDAGDAESDAFYDVVVGGMGWTETRIDYEESADGEAEVNRIDPFEMLVDCSAKKRNLTDRRRQWRVKRVPCSEAMEMFPGFTKHDLHAQWADLGTIGDDKAVDQDQADLYEDDDTNANDGLDRDDDSEITIVQCMWWERETVHELIDPMTGQRTEMSAEEFRTIDDRFKKLLGRRIPSIKRKRRIYKQAFLGRKMLDQSDAQSQKGWLIQPITGFRDEVEHNWFGMVRAMKDPQRWANKWLSQTMHILNSQAKGGLVMETNAATNQRDFERSWAKSEAISWVAPGTIRNGGMQPKPVAQFPAGFFNLMEYAINSVRDVTGVNLEMLGMREADQPGVLEYQRRQQGMVMLAGLFASLKLYRKAQGRVMLDLMQNYLADGRLIRITGEERAQYVPLAAQQDMEYDIIVDEAPTSPNQKEIVWAAAQNMWGQFPPQVQAAMIEYAPYPESVVQKMKQGYQQAMQPPPPDPRIQADVQETMSTVEKNQAQTLKLQADAAKVANDIQKTPAELAKMAAETEKTTADAFATGAQTGNMLRQTEMQEAATRNGTMQGDM